MSALAAGRPFAASVSLVDRTDEVPALLLATG